jgi:hypothetical protein
MIYKTFTEWKNGNYLEDLEPRKEAYTKDELLLIEMGWNYGYDAGVEAGRKDENEACAKVCEEPIDEIQITDDCSEYKYRDNQECADAIRARREQ